ncbi:ABC transporter substrate-binding protein [Bailinhaonella thermotolerans]|uniref:ABC transporter substrate-binding protein n=1 Tax=Bailinhaonella thermotolerans TaxID=1070861 RepID=A0A3A4B4U4_9ACTN|nr:ABC transporter substrate-binding protein [Bailinhaonella thermotolerans]
MLATACTAGDRGGPGSGPAKDARQTISLWVGFTAESEVKAFNDAIAAFTAKNPHITVKVTPGADDDKIIQAIRGGNPPDVASSFTTDNVAQFCKAGIFQDLGPYLAASKVDVNALLPRTVRDYTRFEGRRCVMPLLADAYGLYYNKRLMNGERPPRTLSELSALTRKLTKRAPNGDIEVAGFLPSSQYYENTAGHLAPMTGAKWYNPDGTSAIGSDPAWKRLLTWQKELVDWYGHARLEKFRKGLGQEFAADNPFHKGKVAMALDGEWRNAMIASDAPGLEYGTAPLPVADDRPDLYGGGFISGTIVGIPRGSRHPQAAWELVRHLTTDTDALVTLSNALRNVPSTIPALTSPKLKKDANFQTFIDIFNHPASSTVPAHVNGAFNQEVIQEFMAAWEAGRVKDLAEGLRGVDRKIDDKLRLAGG